MYIIDDNYGIKTYGIPDPVYVYPNIITNTKILTDFLNEDPTSPVYRNLQSRNSQQRGQSFFLMTSAIAGASQEIDSSSLIKVVAPASNGVIDSLNKINSSSVSTIKIIGSAFKSILSTTDELADSSIVRNHLKNNKGFLFKI